MIGHQSGFRARLFYCNASLEKRIPKDHIPRKIHETIYLDFIYHKAQDTYRYNGKVSAPLTVIL
jgi:hypothetical protein